MNIDGKGVDEDGCGSMQTDAALSYGAKLIKVMVSNIHDSLCVPAYFPP